MRFLTAFPAAIAAITVLSLSASFASAGDTKKIPDALPATAKTRVLVFGDGAARFNVERDASAGRMTFRLADPATKIDGAPVVLMTTDAGLREIALTPVDGGWTWSDDAVKRERFDGTMRVVVAGKSYTSPLASVWTADGGAKARFGGRVTTFPDCGASVEVVQDPATGTLTIYSAEDVVIAEAPVITVTESTGPTVVTMTKVEGKAGVWTTKHERFKVTTTSARIRLLVNGSPCEAALVYGAGRGGQIVAVAGGPSFEVVHDAAEGCYTFYAVDETINGKPYTIENPTIVVGGRTYNMTRVENEPRAWRVIGIDSTGSDARDGQLNFTALGKTMSTRVGLSGVGVGVK